MSTFYEKHNYLDPDFPIFFHHDHSSRENSRFPTHWHEHIELLYITDGMCLVCGNGITLKAAPGGGYAISLFEAKDKAATKGLKRLSGRIR